MNLVYPLQREALWFSSLPGKCRKIGVSVAKTVSFSGASDIPARRHSASPLPPGKTWVFSLASWRGVDLLCGASSFLAVAPISLSQSLHSVHFPSTGHLLSSQAIFFFLQFFSWEFLDWPRAKHFWWPSTLGAELLALPPSLLIPSSGAEQLVALPGRFWPCILGLSLKFVLHVCVSWGQTGILSYFLLKYTWCTILHKLQVYNKVIHIV